MDCTGRCEFKYCNTEFVIVLDVFFVFTSIIECYKKGSAVYTYNIVNKPNNSLDSTGRNMREMYKFY